VAILMLIALSLVLIVTTSGISQMERKAVANSTKDEIAKRNAIFALEVALAQLQREAGPDQRVTATADIYNTNATNANVSQPYWTGVWKSFNPAWTNDPARSSAWNRVQPLDIKMSGQSTPILRDWSTNSTNVVWLVSGAADNTTINPFSFGSNAATSSSNSVVVATGWGTNSNTVSVPLVSINAPGPKVSATNPVPGRYAYWVSDEGVKAKVTLVDTNLTKKPVTSTGMLVSSLVHFLGAAPPYLPSVMTNYGGLPNAPDIRTNSTLPLFTSLSGLQYVDPSYAGITNNALAADFTVWSYGVICDVRNGGLKQDLTAALESTIADPSNFQSLLYRSGRQSGNLSDNDSIMAYRASSAGLPMDLSSQLSQVPSSCVDGLRWQSVYNFYNLYKSRWPQSPIITSPVGTNPAGIGIPSIQTFNRIQSCEPVFQDPAGSKVQFSSLTPALVCESVVAQLSVTNMTLNPTNGPRNFFQVSYYPLVVLYNPYSVALDLGNTAFIITKNLAAKVSVKLNCTDSSSSTLYTNSSSALSTPNNLWPEVNSSGTFTNTVLQVSGNGYALSLVVTNTPGTIMIPGEIKVYSLAGKNIQAMSSNLDGYALFTNTRALVSTNNLTLGNGFGGVTVTLTNWEGSKSSLDQVSMSYLFLGAVNYNTYHFTPTATYNSSKYTINTWPLANVSVGNIDLPGSLIGTATGNYSGTNISTLIGLLSNNPLTILSVTERLKGIIPGSQFLSYIGLQTNIPTFAGNSLFFNAHRACEGLGGVYCPATETCTIITNEPLVSIVNSAVASNASTLSWVFKPVGDDPAAVTDKSTNNNVFMVTRDIPFAPMTSLGQLMHLDDYYNNIDTIMSGKNVFPLGIPGMSIGGSFCSPETGPFINSIYYNGNSGTNQQWHVFNDNSFLGNQALFDTYFFSTVPPSKGFTWGIGTGGIGPYSANLSSNSIATNQPLPNTRHVFYRKNGTNPLVADLQDESKASANLLIDGPFNVNSTSVSSWKSLLTSLNGQTFPIYNYISGQFENRYVSNPILRFWSVGRYNPNDPWDGMRSLSDQQVTSLAQEIVKQVRKRGPFLSMGDFLNRRMASSNSVSVSSTNLSLYLMGALQEAIENTQTNGVSSDVNSNIHNKLSISTSNNFNVPVSWGSLSGQIFPTTNNLMIPASKIATNTAAGIPGYLMQQDLVQAFAPVMSVRSDTFVIRVYGEADRKTTSKVTSPIIEGRAWGEAVVQRVPDYIDQTDPALTKPSVIKGVTTPLGDATPLYGRTGRIVGTLNESLGRRFRIVSFRWLNQSDL